MTATVQLKITLESLTDAISSLSLEQKRQLVEILEQQIFEAEEENYEDDSQTLAEIEAVQTEYATGEYVTFDEYVKTSFLSST